MKDVRGMSDTVDAVTVAARKKKNMLLAGPPGIAKTMLARRIPTLLHKLGAEGALSLKILYQRYNLEGEFSSGDVPPFRAPHHSIGDDAMWHSKYRTGEVGMAACGVLFLDEIIEFRTSAIRVAADAVLDMQYSQSAPLVVASSTACPCGWFKSTHKKCTCADRVVLLWRDQIKRYCDALSIDTIINVPLVTLEHMREAPVQEIQA